ncbi:comm domain-containing protein 2, partial [Lasius niger]
MLLTLKPDHKKHVLFLAEQSPPVLQDFCKLALDYLQKGPNVKVYNAAAQKLNVELDAIKNSVEGLVNLLLESCKHKLNPEDFRDSVIALGFTEEKEAILSKLYSIKKDEISNALEEIGFKLPGYHDMEWRFEVQKMESLITVGAENLTSIILPGLSTTTFADVLTTTNGPQAMRQIMGFNNQTVVDKVPPEMLHLVDPH